MRDLLPTVLLMAVGCVALGTSAWEGWRTATFLGRASRAEGVIVDAAPHPRVRFAVAGRPVEFVQNGFLSRPLGSAVPVAYDDTDPAGTAEATTFWACWGSALFPLPMGLGFTLLPLFGFRAVWKIGRH